MFEKTKIRFAASNAIKRLPTEQAERDTFYIVVSHSPMLPAAIAGLKTGVLASPAVAVAYLCAAIIEAVSRSDDMDEIGYGIIAHDVAYNAMDMAGATHEEATETISEMVAIHKRSVDKLPVPVSEILRR